MTNIAATLEAQLDAISLCHLRSIAEVARSHNLQAYLVGGVVRDALLGLPVADIDVAVVGLAPSFVRDTARALSGEIVARSQFGTFALDIEGRRIDLAVARCESYAHPGALPSVLSGTIEQDLARRDFTINAMAVSLNPGSFGELLDPFSGRRDLEAESVRVLHDASFQDDATRILRAVRYAVRLGFALESETERLLRRDASYLSTISAPRLRDELDRVLREGRAVSILEMLDGLDALRRIHAGVTLSPQTLRALRRAGQSDYTDKPALLLSILTYTMTESEKANFVERLQLNSRLRKTVLDTGLARVRVQDKTAVDVLQRSEIYMRLKDLDEAAILGCALSEDGSAAAQRLMLYLNELRHIESALKGNDLLALGVRQGPELGALLMALLEARLDGKIQTRQDEIDFVKAHL